MLRALNNVLLGIYRVPYLQGLFMQTDAWVRVAHCTPTSLARWRRGKREKKRLKVFCVFYITLRFEPSARTHTCTHSCCLAYTLPCGYPVGVLVCMLFCRVLPNKPSSGERLTSSVSAMAMLKSSRRRTTGSSPAVDTTTSSSMTNRIQPSVQYDERTTRTVRTATLICLKGSTPPHTLPICLKKPPLRQSPTLLETFHQSLPLFALGHSEGQATSGAAENVESTTRPLLIYWGGIASRGPFDSNHFL